jgi:hypothetical protein
MKKLLLITLMNVCILTVSKAQTADTFYNKIYKLDLQFFAGKPVGQLIDSLPAGYTKMNFLGTFATSHVRLLYVEYPGGSNLHIYVKDFHYMNPIDTNWVWNLNLFKKESLHYVVLLHPEFQSKNGGQ